MNKYENFLICTLGGRHLRGFNYILYILNNGENSLKGIYDNAAKHFNTTYSSLERSIRYYIEYVIKINEASFLEDMLDIKIDNKKITNKMFIKQIYKIIDKYNNFKVFCINEDEWLATNLELEDSLKIYCDEMGEDLENYIGPKSFYLISEINIDEKGMYHSPINKEDRKRMGSLYSIHKCKDKTSFGDLMWHDGEIFKYISYREAIRRNKPNIEEDCFVIASANY